MLHVIGDVGGEKPVGDNEFDLWETRQCMTNFQEVYLCVKLCVLCEAKRVSTV